MDLIWEFGRSFLLNAEQTMYAMSDPNHRIYYVYVLTSVIMAFLIFKSSKAKLVSDEKTFLRFLFPKKVWNHPSAWLDLRYFFFHSLIGKFLIAGFYVAVLVTSFRWASGGISITEATNQSTLSTGQGIALSIAFMIVTMVISDFMAWYCHYLQHKSPLLWQFHKVHHSAEVMHPVSNYREHPIDNLLYNTVLGATYGIVVGATLRFLGYIPSVPALLGIPLLTLAFNAVGYNLRHSHIWLRWPGKWSMIFPSPAHHHVHHSSHPDHLDKNFAFMFPIWDVIFKTYHMPEDNRDVKFGIGEGNAEELTSCTRLYWVPFRDAYRVVQAQIKGVAFNMSKPEPVKDRKNHPAE